MLLQKLYLLDATADFLRLRRDSFGGKIPKKSLERNKKVLEQKSLGGTSASLPGDCLVFVYVR